MAMIEMAVVMAMIEMRTGVIVLNTVRATK